MDGVSNGRNSVGETHTREELNVPPNHLNKFTVTPVVLAISVSSFRRNSIILLRISLKANENITC
jgi:hypothetical protein